MSNNPFHNTLTKTKVRAWNDEPENICFLDKNEQAYDTNQKLKSEVISNLQNTAWNRYPKANYQEIEKLLAEYLQVENNQVALGPGAASILSYLLNYFALNNFQIVIPQPSYSFFNYHCQTYNIAFVPWHLDQNRQYDIKTLPALLPKSAVFIVSPNNPVGNCIAANDLIQLLSQHPNTVFILDAVYQEFSHQNFTSLINEFRNLIIVRSFSKAFPIAGARLAYMLSHKKNITELKKLVLPFSINHFSLIYAKTLLSNPEFIALEKQNINTITKSKKYLSALISSQFDSNQIHILPSSGNFLLLQFSDNEQFKKLEKSLARHKIQVLNTSDLYLLENSIRVSIGTPAECDAFFQCLVESFT